VAPSADLPLRVGRRLPRVPRARLLAGVAVLAAAGPLAGCASTQQKAARLQLSSARLRAEQVPTRIRHQSTSVRAVNVTLLRQGKRTAFIVTVTNHGDKAVSDLPILVGYRGAGGSGVYVNGAVGGDYFASHLPLVAPGASLRWVVTTTRRIPTAAKLLAEVGARPSVAVAGLQKSSDVAVSARAKATGDVLSVAVRNDSGVTQYGLPLYAVADRGGRAVAAGSTSITELDGNATRTVHIRLLGSAGTGASVQVEAIPTIFN
jgi:hypothetical protein